MLYQNKGKKSLTSSSLIAGSMVIVGFILAVSIIIAITFILIYTGQNTIKFESGNKTFIGHRGSVISLATSGTELIASGSSLGEIFIWDITKGLTQKIQSTGSIKSLNFLDLNNLISISSDGTLTFWDIQNVQSYRINKYNNYGSFNSLVLNDQKQILIRTSSNNILIFDPSGNLINTFKMNSNILSISLLKNGNLVTTSGFSLNIWDLNNFVLLKTFNTYVPTNNLLVTKEILGLNESIVYSSGLIVYVLDAQTGDLIRTITVVDTITSLTQLSNGLIAVSTRNSVFYYNLATGQLINYVLNLNGQILTILANGDNILLGTNFGAVLSIINEKIFINPSITSIQTSTTTLNKSTTQLGTNTTITFTTTTIPTPNGLNILSIHNGSITSLSIESNKIASGSVDGSVSLIDRQNSNILFNISMQSSVVYVKFLNDSILLSITNNGFINFISVNTGKILNTKVIFNRINSSVITPNGDIVLGTIYGDILVFGDNFEVKKNEIVHSGSVNLLVILDANSYASVSYDSVKIWNINTHELEGQLDVSVVGLIKFNNGNLLTITNEGILSIWSTANVRKARFLNYYTISFSVVLSEKSSSVNSLNLLSNGNLLIGTKDSLIEYNLITRQEINNQKIDVSSVVVDPLGEIIIGTSKGELYFQVSMTSSSIPIFQTTIDTTFNTTQNSTTSFLSNSTTISTSTTTKLETTSTPTNLVSLTPLPSFRKYLVYKRPNPYIL
ncbi:unnamed protein product [Brachionus calyciflorus]|uniref:Uncharacterized protein n=1 Tax=Brachionus calyciflorus TaxID=104777 RepID=A0A813PGN8_9BILA|nr:unnamed protein product [Brachionus calyciflorus]